MMELAVKDSQYSFDVFVSYSHMDKPWVYNWLLPRLEQAAIRVCIDFRDFDVGIPILVNIERAIERSNKTLLILTPNWVSSEWTSFEALLTQTTDPSGLRRRVLPLLLEPCEPPRRVSVFTYADFTQPEKWNVQLARIIDALHDKVKLIEQEIVPTQVSNRVPSETLTDNLPEPLNSFVGRKHECAEIKRILSTTRLLTLTGAPGVGKTRLALELARNLRKEFNDGVWLVDLGTLEMCEDSNVIAREVASKLGIHEVPDQLWIETLLDYLKFRDMLLLLDNCEHLVDWCALLVNSLLSACPKLKILVTSRQPLDTPGELAWPVPPLSLPAEHECCPCIETLTESEAICLFVERARFNNPMFSVTEENVTAVAQICRRLDGLPLAIELVAVWLNNISTLQIASRLEDHFWILTRGHRGVAARQQALSTAIDWSYNLLSEEERRLFNRLSVFVGGFMLEAAEQVGAGEKVQAYDILDLLARLVDKSLVKAEVGSQGEMRYRLLETLRRYGKEQLAAIGETAAIRRAHAMYYLAVAETAEPNLQGPEQTTWQERLEKEFDNFRTALYWALDARESEYGLRLAGALERFWWLRGHLSEGRQWLEQTLGQGGVVPGLVCAKAFLGVGVLAYRQGDLVTSRTYLEKSLAAYRGSTDEAGIANSLYYLGVVTFIQDDSTAAHVLFTQSLDVYRELKDRRGIAEALIGLGAVAMHQNEFVAAHDLYEESLNLFRGLGHKPGVANAANELGMVARLQGDLEAALSLLQESLAICKELGYKEGVARALSNLGSVALDQGDYFVAHHCFEEGLQIAKELGAKEGIAYLLEGCASLAVIQQQPIRASQLLGSAETLREAIGAPMPPDSRITNDRIVAALHSHLSETAFTCAWKKGRTMTLEQAIEVALDKS